jgi:aspartyl protease family protein
MIAAIGVDPTSLNYNIKTSTANGIAYAGAFNIDSLSVGSIHFAKVNVLVNQTPLDTCLLGMSFLNRLKSFEVEDDRLTLVP